MLRASHEELRTYLALHPNEDVDLHIFLEQANNLVNEELATSGLSDNRKKAIELNLAAHFTVIALEKGGITRARVGDSEEGYRQDFTSKPNLSMTRYGQQAVMLDTSGALSALNAPAGKAEFRVM